MALKAVKTRREVLKRPALTGDGHIDMLARQGLGETVVFLRRWRELI